MNRRFHWPDRDLMYTEPRYTRRPPCNHGPYTNRKPIRFDLGEGTNVWGGKPPERNWKLGNVVVISLLEYYTHSHDVRYPIYNYSTPREDCATFDCLIDELVQRTTEGDMIYIHCFGGHGRTGLVFGCMAAKMGFDNPVEYVRKNYCPRAIENDAQEIFVNEYE